MIQRTTLNLTKKITSKLVKRSGVSLPYRGYASQPEKYEDEPMLPPDYPHLPLNNFQKRNPWIYDDQQDRRNFGEPLNQQDEILTVWGPDQYDLPARTAVFELACVAGIIATGAYLYSYIAPKSPAVPRSYPFNGLREELGNDPNSKTNNRPTVNTPAEDE